MFPAKQNRAAYLLAISVVSSAQAQCGHTPSFRSIVTQISSPWRNRSQTGSPSVPSWSETASQTASHLVSPLLPLLPHMSRTNTMNRFAWDDVWRLRLRHAPRTPRTHTALLAHTDRTCQQRLQTPRFAPFKAPDPLSRSHQGSRQRTRTHQGYPAQRRYHSCKARRRRSPARRAAVDGGQGRGSSRPELERRTC